MPAMLQWLKALEQTDFQYKEHIVWIKRIITGAMLKLLRGHESLLIYRKGDAEYIETKGRYSDVKMPGVMFDAVSITSIKRYIASLHKKIVLGIDSDLRKQSKRSNPIYAYMHSISDFDRSPEYCNFTNVWSFLPEMCTRRNKGVGQHPTMKPIKLFERLLVLCTKKGEAVFDSFAGSGTTLLAAVKSGRICYCMEKEPKYVDLICQRYFNLTGDMPQEGK